MDRRRRQKQKAEAGARAVASDEYFRILDEKSDASQWLALGPKCSSRSATNYTVARVNARLPYGA